MDYRGTAGSDSLDQQQLGLPSGSVIYGLEGNDTLSGSDANLIGGSGNDRLVGLGQWATATYWFAPAGVDVNLTTGVAHDGEGGADTLVGIRVVHGSSFIDTLRGSAADEVFHGHGSNDTIDGGAGFDQAQFIFSDPSGYSYEWDPTAGGLRVTDTRTSDGDDGSVLLISIEEMLFNGAGGETQTVHTNRYMPSAWSHVGSRSFHAGDAAVPRHVVGDFDGNGTIDILAHFTPAAAFGSNSNPAGGAVQFWSQDASGAYTKRDGVVDAATPILGSEMVAADLNGDGVIDPVLFAAGWDPYVDGQPVNPAGGYPGEEPFIWASNSGSQRLVEGAFPSTFGHHGAAGDIDGDNDVDLYVSSISVGAQGPHFLINDGTGRFTVRRDLLPDEVENDDAAVLQTFDNGVAKVWIENRFTASALIDANGDGALDLAVLPIAGSGTARIYINDGAGQFTNAARWNLPASPYGSGVAKRDTPTGPNIYDGPNYLDTAVLDFNRDGKMDLVAVVTENRGSAESFYFYRGTTVQFFQNTGTGFIDVTAQRTDFEHDVAFNQWHYDQVEVADVDQDGFADLLIQRSPDVLTIPSTRILHNDGTGFFADRAIPSGIDDGVLIPVDAEAGLMVSLRNTHVLGHDGTAADAVVDVDTMRFDFSAGRDFFTGQAIPSAALTSTQAGRWLHGTRSADTMTLSAGDEQAWGYSGNDILRGLGGNDRLDGGEGIDTAVYSGSRGEHTIGAGGASVTGGVSGADTLVSIERLVFDDVRLAFDLSGNAGTVARLLGAVFGASFVNNPGYAGIGLSLADSGMSPAELAQLAIDVRLGANPSNAQLVDLLYTNVMGVVPDAGTRQYFVSFIEGGQYTQAGLAILAADSSFNATHIGLTGLAATGLAYV